MKPIVGVAARLILLGAVLGACAGAVWVLVAPRPELIVQEGVVRFADTYPTDPASDNLWLGVILAAVGLIMGCWTAVRLRRTGFASGPGRVLCLVVGALVASGTAWLVGAWLGRAQIPQDLSGVADGTVLTAPLAVGGTAVLLLAPAVALLVVLLVGAFSGDPEFTSRSEPSGPV